MVGKRTPGSVPERGTSLNPKHRNVAGKVVMRSLLAGLSLAVVTVGQVKPNPETENQALPWAGQVKQESQACGIGPVRFYANGWLGW